MPAARCGGAREIARARSRISLRRAPQHEKLVAADGGLGAKIADRLGRGLLDGGKALLETKRVQALVIGVELVEIDDIGILLVRLDALDDLVFDIVQGLGVGWWADFPPRARCRARQPQFVGDAIDVEVEKNRGGRTVTWAGWLSRARMRAMADGRVPGTLTISAACW